MRTHVELDDRLLNQVLRLGGFLTKEEAVDAALLEFAKSLKRRELLALRGKVEWQGNLEELRSPRRQ